MPRISIMLLASRILGVCRKPHVEFSLETRRNSQKVTAHIPAFHLTETTTRNRSNQPQRRGWQHQLEKIHLEGNTLMCVATALSRQVAERQRLQWDWCCSAFSHVSSLKPAIEVGGGLLYHVFPSKSKWRDCPWRTTEDGLQMGKVGLEDKILKCGPKHPYVGNSGTTTRKSIQFPSHRAYKFPMQSWVAGCG